MSDDANNEVKGQEPGNRSKEGGGPHRIPAEYFRLRPERPPVMRLSRKVLAGMAGVSGLAILGALIFALDGSWRGAQPPQELFNTANKTTADGLASLPKDYTGIPQLGPPLPGDLGRPTLNAHAAVPPAPGFDTAEQRIVQESEAARTSHVFATTSARERHETGPAPAAAPSNPQLPPSLLADQKPALDPSALQNTQDRKLAFLNGTTDRRTVSFDRLQNPASSYVVQAGTVIPAALITGIQSDLPGRDHRTSNRKCF